MSSDTGHMVSGPATSVFLLAPRQSARVTSWLLGNRREGHSTGLTELKAAAASDDKGVFKPGPTGKERSCHFCVEIMHEGSQADCQHLEGALGSRAKLGCIGRSAVPSLTTPLVSVA